MNNQPIKLSKVIQFADPGDIRRINKNYFGLPSEWNPNGDIALLPIDTLSVLKEQGVTFEQNPSINSGVSTFVEVIPNKYSCIEREKYAPSLITSKQKVMAIVLQKLGIHEYFIHSSFHANAEIGVGGKKEVGANVECTTQGSASINSESSYNNGFNANAYKVDVEFSRCKPFLPTMEEWQEAKDLACAANIYSEICDIIEMRKPGKGRLECKTIITNIGGSIDINISLASSLKAIAGLGAFGNIGGKYLNNFDFNAKLEGQYETTIFYNFDPELKSDVYQRFVDARVGKIIDQL